MAVAEKPLTFATTPRNPRVVLMMHGVLGALYVLASLWLVFLGLPTLWRAFNTGGILNEFLADSLLFLVTLPVIFGLFVLGRYLEGPNPVRGLRAASVYLSCCVIIGGLIATAGGNLWPGVGLVLLAGSIIFYFQSFCLDWLVRVEEQGWFHALSFKGNQGLRVRRCTVIALMVLALCGIYTLYVHGSLHTASGWLVSANLLAFWDEPVAWAPATDPWMVTVPFTTTRVVFLYYISLTIPLLILVTSAWLSWRLVNWPAFADFLIATEAEMNKVSWTTRKRLYQDTIVVLTTVVLLTVFLFVVDILWIKILTNPWVDVLKHDPQAAARKSNIGAQW